MSLDFKFEKNLGTFQLKANGVFQEGMTGLFGPTGCGKSTLLKILSGVMHPDSGEIKLNSETCFSSSQNEMIPLEERRIGMVWQEALLFPHLNVKANVEYGWAAQGPKPFYDRVWDIFQLAKLQDRMPKHLSGGEKQRVAIARALLHQPAWLLLDEPLVALDVPTRQRIGQYLRTVQQELKIPIVLVSHSVNEILQLCDEVVIMENGQLKQTGTPEDLFLNEEHLPLLQEDLENLFELPVLHLNAQDQTLDLDLGGKVLKVACTQIPLTKQLKVGIKAKDILVATSLVQGISARNKIYSTIEKIEPAEEKVLLACRMHTHKIWVEITPGSFRDLNLALGQGIYLIMKARSIRVIDG